MDEVITTKELTWTIGTIVGGRICDEAYLQTSTAANMTLMTMMREETMMIDTLWKISCTLDTELTRGTLPQSRHPGSASSQGGGGGGGRSNRGGGEQNSSRSQFIKKSKSSGASMAVWWLGPWSGQY